MKLTCLSILMLLSLPNFSQSAKVKLKLVQYMPYCGGRRPSKEIEEGLNKPIPYANKKLIYISDKQLIDTLITNAQGVINVKLPCGTYRLFEPWKYYHKTPALGEPVSNIDTNCLKQEWIKEDLKLTVYKRSTMLVNNIMYPSCSYSFPCIIKKHLPN